MFLVIDTESNGLLNEADRLFSICAADIDTGDRYSFAEDEIEEGLELLSQADTIVGHNILMHDLPLIQKLYPSFTYGNVHDTFIMSALYMPDRPGGHSVEAYENVTGIPKVAHEDWSQWSPEMQHRCEQDVEGNILIWQHLVEKMGLDKSDEWDKALELEYSVARVQAQQSLNGVLFNVKAARKLYKKIDVRIKEIEHILHTSLPDKWVMHGSVPVNKPFKKDGTYSKAVEDWMQEEVQQVGGPFTRLKTEQFNINSDAQVKDYFLKQGWQPTQWNYKKDPATGFRMKDSRGQHIKSSPKLTEDSYDTIQGDLPRLIAERAVLLHRRSLIFNIRKTDGKYTGWANIVRPDGRISADAIPQATNTGRYRHKGIVNVPKASERVLYGQELRSLFIVPEGKKMVGVDAKALENRIEGHYTAFFDGGEYANTLLEGDPHTSNAVAFSNALGIEVDRNLSKSIKYAITYGAQPPKVAETAGVKPKAGKMLFETFWKNNPALAHLYRSVQKQIKKRGYLVGLDGRRIRIRNEHAALNALFQCAGSLTVKKATSLLWEGYVPQHELDAKIVLHFHDEFQAEVGNSDVDKYVELALASFKDAGEAFNLNIPIEGDAQVGTNWKDTH